RALPPRPVIDPSLPPDVSVELRSNLHVLRLARAGWRMEKSGSGVWRFVIPGLLLLILMLTSSPALSVAASAGIGLFALLRWMAVGSYERTTRRRLELAYTYADPYMLPGDRDYPWQVLLRRAQRAAEAIRGSPVHRAALIDTSDNRVTLP